MQLGEASYFVSYLSTAKSVDSSGTVSGSDIVPVRSERKVDEKLQMPKRFIFARSIRGSNFSQI